MPSEPRVYTIEEANKLVPKLAIILPELRRMRDKVMKQRDLHDVEEIVSHGTNGEAAHKSRQAMDFLQGDIRRIEKEFEKALRFFEEAGCELKGIDPGLVDFFYERDGGEMAYLCWAEGETALRFWHPLTGGFAGREPL